LNQNPSNVNLHLDPDLLNQAYSQFFKFVSEFVGDKKAKEFAGQSYKSTEKYYSGISTFQIDDQNQLRFKNFELGDREILGFGIWMYQFIKELQNFMVGIGKVDPNLILGKWAGDFESTNFFEYFKQARELKY